MAFISNAYTRVAELAGAYDAFLVDLWGVIHDGQALYPGVKECLEQLHKARKRICFLSNAPRRAAKAEAKLTELGIPRGAYERVITSGELTFLRLSANRPDTRYYFIGPDRDRDLMQDSALKPVARLEEAGLLLNVGFLDEEDEAALARYLPLLHEACVRNLPMVCANPDDFIVRLDGRRLPCAGLMALAYEEMGGRVIWYGKPHTEVYDLCLSFWPEIPRERILAIGDNLATDIKGGAGAGLATALVTGGVLKVELGLKDGAPPPAEALERKYEESGARPDFTMAAFSWKDI